MKRLVMCWVLLCVGAYGALDVERGAASLTVSNIQDKVVLRTSPARTQTLDPDFKNAGGAEILASSVQRATLRLRGRITAAGAYDVQVAVGGSTTSNNGGLWISVNKSIGIRSATFNRSTVSNLGWDGGVGNTIVPQEGDAFIVTATYDASVPVSIAYTYTYENISSDGSRDFSISESVPLANWPTASDTSTLLGSYALARGSGIELLEYEYTIEHAPEYGFLAVGALSAVNLYWDAWADDTISAFEVGRSLVEGGPYVPLATVTTNLYRDFAVTNGIDYYYTLTAADTNGAPYPTSPEVSAAPVSNLPPVRPNFVFIITDDQDIYSVQRYRELEPCETTEAGLAYPIDTPNIDRLADEGMLFHQARNMGAWSGAVCTPSRMCIMTGQNSWQVQSAPAPAEKTFPGIFNRGVGAGRDEVPYATYRTCKEGNSYPTANHEFTLAVDASRRGNTDGYGSEWHAENALDFIDDWNLKHQPVNKPFFMYLGFSHPHDERLAREDPDLVGRYGCVNVTNPASILLNPAAPPLPANALTAAPGVFPVHPFNNGHLELRDEQDVLGIYEYRTEAVIRNEIGRNFACVDWIDRQLGRVFEKLEDPNGDGDTSDSVMDTTYIVFTSDHGIAIGRHGLQGKQSLYEHSWRVPYIVRGPGIAAGARSDALIYLHDTFPTFMDLAGFDVPDTIDANDGMSFRSVLEGSNSAHRATAYGLYSGGDKPGMRAVTDGRFKLIKYDVDNNASQVTQLFDLETNPFELLPEQGVSNLATQTAYALVRQELEETLMEQRILNEDPYKFLGDRVLLRFEDNLEDRMPFGRDGHVAGVLGGAPPAFVADTPGADEYVVGETNSFSLAFNAAQETYIEVPDARELDFGNQPFTLEAWVKLAGPSVGPYDEGVLPVLVKADGSTVDYMLLAAAGSFGDATTYGHIALCLGGYAHISSLSITDTNWHYLAASYDPVGVRVRLVLDDVMEEMPALGSGTQNAGPLAIGARPDAVLGLMYGFTGLIDEVSVTDGWLAKEELQPLRHAVDPSAFELVGVRPSEGAIALEFESDERLLYDVEHTGSLLSNDWHVAATMLGGDAGTNVTSVLMERNAGEGFYRVRASGPARP